MLPVEIVSTDQYKCKVKGRLPNTRGKEDHHKIFCGRTIFLDHGSSKIDVCQQVSLGASDNIRSKDIYKQKYEEVGVKIKKYRSDNGFYKSAAFKYNTAARGQLFNFLRVGTYGQNGVAERGIQTVVNSARTMMLH